jgi:hypothetical protein
MSEEIKDATLPGWTFTRKEVSAGAWKVEGRHVDGRSVERTGYGYEEGLEKSKEDARTLPERRKRVGS